MESYKLLCEADSTSLESSFHPGSRLQSTEEVAKQFPRSNFWRQLSEFSRNQAFNRLSAELTELLETPRVIIGEFIVIQA